MKAFIAAIVLSLSTTVVAAEAPKPDPKTKRVCKESTDAKTGKTREVCKTIKIHKKHEGTKVPEKKK